MADERAGKDLLTLVFDDRIVVIALTGRECSKFDRFGLGVL
jgi:hypothetical protein